MAWRFYSFLSIPTLPPGIILCLSLSLRLPHPWIPASAGMTGIGKGSAQREGRQPLFSILPLSCDTSSGEGDTGGEVDKKFFVLKGGGQGVRLEQLRLTALLLKNYQPPGGQALDLTIFTLLMLLLWHSGQVRLFSSVGPLGAGISNLCPHSWHLYCHAGGP